MTYTLLKLYILNFALFISLLDFETKIIVVAKETHRVNFYIRRKDASYVTGSFILNPCR